MSPEARRILQVFAGRSAGHTIMPWDFGDAIVWEAGYIRDEPVRLGFVELLEGEYIIEHPAGIELSSRGEQILRNLV